MRLFKKNKKIGLIADIIRCDEPSYLIWKWHPDGTQLGEHKREYAIRCGSHLRVKDGEVAVFVYKQKDGTMQDYIVGPFDEKIKTSNFPILSGLIGSFVGGDTPFQAEVYFINLAQNIQVKFVVPFFDVCDVRYPDFSVPIAVRGAINFKIDNYRNFIKLHRLTNFNLEDFQEQIGDSASRYVKDAVASATTKYNITVVQIESKTSAINEVIENDIKKRFEESFGVIVSGVDIGAIEIDKTSSDYKELVAITKEVATATIQEQTAINIENYAETLRVQREEGQYAMHKQTQSANLGAYQIEKQAEVGVAGADALGKMGEKNAGNINLGGNGGGFNPAAMMASMAVGGVVGQKIASVMNDAMNGNNTISTPPPIPKVVYYVAKDGKPTGPFDVAKLTEMVANGKLLAEDLVWKQGMATWCKAKEVDDLKGLFPPEIK